MNKYTKNYSVSLVVKEVSNNKVLLFHLSNCFFFLTINSGSGLGKLNSYLFLIKCKMV